MQLGAATPTVTNTFSMYTLCVLRRTLQYPLVVADNPIDHCFRFPFSGLFVFPSTDSFLLSFVPLVIFKRASVMRHVFGAAWGNIGGPRKRNAMQDSCTPSGPGPIRPQTLASRLPVRAKSGRPDPSVDLSGSVVGPVCLEHQPLGASPLPATRSKDARACFQGPYRLVYYIISDSRRLGGPDC